MISGLIVILIAGVARYADYYLSVAPLQYDNGGDRWYQQDVRLGVFGRRRKKCVAWPCVAR
ncbi:MAG TPA: hypothetical protein VGH53_30250 [Streptosporangiaceae bacterium]|jgi:hypothetical protein